MIPWHELWEAEPGLRPKHPEGPGLLRRLIDTDSKPRWCWANADTSDEEALRLSKTFLTLFVTPGESSVYCFAQAVKWLAQEWVVVIPTTLGFEAVRFGNQRPPTITFNVARGDTPEAAAFAACKALIGARRTANATSPTSL